jgi:hypothetical protein
MQDPPGQLHLVWQNRYHRAQEIRSLRPSTNAIMSAADRPVLARDLAGTVAYAGVDLTLEGRTLEDAIRRAIVTCRGSCWWDVDHAGWVVTLSSPEEQTFYGRTLEEALAWCLVWLMAPELGIGPFLV